MKIATWNVNSLNVRLPHVLRWLEESQVDVLCLQELKLAPEKFPQEIFEQLHYHIAFNAQKTYNGVAIISKYPLSDISYDLPGLIDTQKRVIAATVEGVRIINAYCVNGESLESEKFIYKRNWFQAFHHYIAQTLSDHTQLIVLGDFNIAPNDVDVYDANAWMGKILCSEEERSWFQELLDLGLSDAIRELNPDDVLYTWWDYRLNAFKRNMGMRIDHILLTSTLKTRLKTFGIAKDARAWERPSDHAAVWVDFN